MMVIMHFVSKRVLHGVYSYLFLVSRSICFYAMKYCSGYSTSFIARRPVQCCNGLNVPFGT